VFELDRLRWFGDDGLASMNTASVDFLPTADHRTRVFHVVRFDALFTYL